MQLTRRSVEELQSRCWARLPLMRSDPSNERFADSHGGGRDADRDGVPYRYDSR